MTSAAVRRTARFCDGWLPQRMPFKVLDGMIARLRELERIREPRQIKISYSPGQHRPR